MGHLSQAPECRQMWDPSKGWAVGRIQNGTAASRLSAIGKQGPAKGEAPAERVNFRCGRGECSNPVTQAAAGLHPLMSELAEKVPQADRLGGGGGGRPLIKPKQPRKPSGLLSCSHSKCGARLQEDRGHRFTWDRAGGLSQAGPWGWSRCWKTRGEASSDSRGRPQQS